MRKRSLLLASVMCGVALASAAAQSRTLPTPRYTKILEVDSMEVAAPSLSPNGKWIAYGAGPQSNEFRSLWVVPAAGGKPIRLTSGDFADAAPVWFPAGDRIVFKSSRVNGALMTIGVNPATGQATTAPQRLTLESPGLHHAVSPDGKFVVFQTVDQRGGLLRIIPAAGGTARTLDSIPPARGGFVSPVFSRDGRTLEYIQHDATSKVETVKRISVEGGSAQTLFEGVPDRLMLTAHGNVLEFERPGAVTLRNFAGDTTARFVLRGLNVNAPRRAVGVTNSPTTILAVTGGSSFELHLLATDGGSPRVLGPARPYDYTGGFLADGGVLIDTRTADGARQAVDVFPVKGARARFAVLPEGADYYGMTNDARLVFARNENQFSIIDVASGRSRIVSQSFVAGNTDYTSRISSADDYGYVERKGDRLEFRAWSLAKNTSRLVRSVPASEGTRVVDYALRGNSAAFTLVSTDSVVLYLSANPTAPLQRLSASGGQHTDGVAFAPDGRHLAFCMQMSAVGTQPHVLGIVELDASGSIVGSPRTLPIETNGLGRLNNEEIVYLNYNTGRPSARLERLSIRAGAEPRIVSQQETKEFWEFYTSPDGKWASYPVAVPGKSTIWKVELSGLKAAN